MTQATNHQIGGVADYFAILGIGDDLIWKDEHKDDEDDEAALMERFYREIVEVNIVTSSHDTEDLTLSPSLSDIRSDFTAGDLSGFTIIETTCPAGSKTDLWSQSETFDANLAPNDFRREILSRIPETGLSGLKRKVTDSIRQQLGRLRPKHKCCYLGFRRRAPDEYDRPAVADLALHFVRIHCDTLPKLPPQTAVQKGVSLAAQVAEAGKQKFLSQYQPSHHDSVLVQMQDLIPIPDGYDEWVIPEPYETIRLPGKPKPSSSPHRSVHVYDQDDDLDVSNSSGVGVEIDVASQPSSASVSSWGKSRVVVSDQDFKLEVIESSAFLPQLVTDLSLDYSDSYIYIPMISIRRQKVGDEQRFREDPAVVEMGVSFRDQAGDVVSPLSKDEDDEFSRDESCFDLVGVSQWSVGGDIKTGVFAAPAIMVKRNHPLGFADRACRGSVLDRFPANNYKGFPLPEEELPMFCYPMGCRLTRARFSDAPLPESYGFVVKNERGDSIHISCVSFFEPLTSDKVDQLNRMSIRRRRVSIPHRAFAIANTNDAGEPEYQAQETSPLTLFDDMVTYENKTICLISRYPFWTVFRRFLIHLHVIATASSELPIERWISHFLLEVPMPMPGGPCVILPLPAFNRPIMLLSPSPKDFPLVDLPFRRLLACLDVPTIVMVVLGFLALEKKVIIMSSRPALVLDACELLRALLFPFDLCAPYVPRLTQPFKSCLDFPGAIFVGIHDDGSKDGLAKMVRNSMLDDTTIVDLDTGQIDCMGDKSEILKHCWDVIPSGPRSVLVSEVETLCRDAGIVPGQEPLGAQMDPDFFAEMSPHDEAIITDRSHKEHAPFDDRALRDAFLRFFCAVLGGYEQFLVVPDADFMISGNEWFDASGFLSSVSKQERAKYLGSLVTTQLFQSFIERRTEASDVLCLLFDEALSEFHSSPIPYGRLGGDVETIAGSDDLPPQMLYSLLVDQCCAESHAPFLDESLEVVHESKEVVTDLATVQSSGPGIKIKDLGMTFGDFGHHVIAPSRVGIPRDARFVYCEDGHPCFPSHFVPDFFHPKEPESLLAEISKNPIPSLSRSDREVEEAMRRQKAATSPVGLRNQRRCSWQLPKLMGSHFLGAWLLCIPSLVSQHGISNESQSKYMLRAFGALRLLRSRHRIVPDEACYRCLMVACGRANTDRRHELVNLYGLLRADGIFPSAVTLGQYTRALAEGYNKRKGNAPTDEILNGVEVTVTKSDDEYLKILFFNSQQQFLTSLDSTLEEIEAAGKKLHRRQSQTEQGAKYSSAASRKRQGDSVDTTRNPLKEKSSTDEKDRRKKNAPWLPVVFSTSFLPELQRDIELDGPWQDNISLVALWSRTTECNSCKYIPLDEEIQAGWDVMEEDNIPGSVACPRCGSQIVPRLGYRQMSIDEALDAVENASEPNSNELPPQLVWNLSSSLSKEHFVAYLSPAALRLSLERYESSLGEESFQRDALRERDPEIFYNLWWYCCRFQLPLPLSTVSEKKLDTSSSDALPQNLCAFAAWDQSVALKGCEACAKMFQGVLYPNSPKSSDAPTGGFARNVEPLESRWDDLSLLSQFKFQSLAQRDWEHTDLSQILVTLVEACDKGDFKPVITCVLQCNERNLAAIINDLSSDGSPTATNNDKSLDCYRTILYLAKYQCTSAFHNFFPATTKACKGYHFWCAFGTPLPVFDRLLRDGVERLEESPALHFASDVALGFRCIFGHIL